MNESFSLTLRMMKTSNQQLAQYSVGEEMKFKPPRIDKRGANSRETHHHAFVEGLQRIGLLAHILTPL